MEIKDLAVGDSVAVYSYGWDVRIRRSTVSKITPTQLIVDGARFRREDGRAVGEKSAWHSTWLKCLDAEVEKDLAEQAISDRRKILAQRFQHKVTWSLFDLDTLERVAEIIDNASN